MINSTTAFLLAMLGGIIGFLAGSHVGYKDAYADVSEIVYLATKAAECGGLETEEVEE